MVDPRPDGRAVTDQTERLRQATRALRVHLDELTVDYRLDTTADRFLTGIAFPFARQRYDCAESLIGASFGGTVIGSLARSLYVDGLRWLWIGSSPDRTSTLLGDLLAERNRLVILVEGADASCPTLTRWLMPLPDIADLTGASLTWLDAAPSPSETELLADLHPVVASPPAPASETQDELLHRLRAMLMVPGLRGAAQMLDHAGHGNYLGQLSALTSDGAVGHDLRADHEGLFMHLAAVGVTATLLGTATAMPDLWPADIDKDRFLHRAVQLTEQVADAARNVHGLRTSTRPTDHKKTGSASPAPTILRPQAILTADALLPDINNLDRVVEATEAYFDVVASAQFGIWEQEQPTLHAALTYGSGHSHLETVRSTYDQPGGAVMAVFAGRMMLEEAARLAWRWAEPDEETYKARAVQYFDDFRSRQAKAINLMRTAGVPEQDAQQLFELPPNVIAQNTTVTKGRQPLPSVASMLRDMGKPYPQPDWLTIAYSLLSQYTHNTPLGMLHTLRVHDGTWHANEVSTEMLGLTLDIAALSSAHLIGTSVLLLTNAAPEAIRYRTRLHEAAVQVHAAARLVHGLD